MKYKKRKIMLIVLVFIIFTIIFISYKSNSNKVVLCSNETNMIIDINSKQIMDDFGNECTVQYSQSLCKMKNLISLNLLCESDLNFLNCFHNLEKLTLFFSNDSMEELNTLPYIENLKELTVISYSPDNYIDFKQATLNNVPNLTSLFVYTSMKNDFSVFSNLNKLESIVYYSKNNVDINGINKIGSLEYFDLESSNVFNYADLEYCNNLKTLSISVNKKSDMYFIMGLDQIEHLRLINTDEEPLIIDENFISFNSSNINSLTLKKIIISDIRSITSMPHLNSLYIYDNYISIEDVEKIRNLGIDVYYI